VELKARERQSFKFNIKPKISMLNLREELLSGFLSPLITSCSGVTVNETAEEFAIFFRLLLFTNGLVQN